MSDIEEKEDDYDSSKRGRNVHLPPTGEVDTHLSHQLQDANKSIATKANTMHDNMSSSHFYSNTTSSSTMLQNTKMSRNDYENTYYQKGNKHDFILLSLHEH